MVIVKVSAGVVSYLPIHAFSQRHEDGGSVGLLIGIGLRIHSKAVDYAVKMTFAAQHICGNCQVSIKCINLVFCYSSHHQ